MCPHLKSVMQEWLNKLAQVAQNLPNKNNRNISGPKSSTIWANKKQSLDLKQELAKYRTFNPKISPNLKLKKSTGHQVPMKIVTVILKRVTD